MTTHEIDEARAGAFAGHMLDIVNGGMLSMMLSIGHRTGLFDTMAALPPRTSAEIADAAGLHERYVREWLGAMVTGRIVDYDPIDGTYHLPVEHAGMLTRAAGPNNLASFAEFIPMLSSVEDDVIESFRSGGGVPYAKFPTFQRLMAEQSALVFDAALLQVVVPLVDGLSDQLAAGIDVADVGCGSGHAINLLAKAYPKSRFIGFDFSDEGVAAGTAEAALLGNTNARFEVKDAATLTGPPAFDLITAFDAIHDQRDPARVLQGIADALRPDGVFLCVDIQASSHVHENMDHPLGPFLYSVSTMHCMTVSLALDGAGLGTAWGHQKAEEMLQEAGFADVEVRQVEADIANNYYIARKHPRG